MTEISEDGAHEGFRASTAFKIILGEEPPAPGDRHSIAELEEYVRSQPLPEASGSLLPEDEEATDESYSAASAALAHAYLTLVEEDASLLVADEVYTKEDIDRIAKANPAMPYDEWAKLIDQPKGKDSALWSAFIDRWPHGPNWIGGISGFMAGWAYNAVRAIRGVAPAENPAILEYSNDSE